MGNGLRLDLDGVDELTVEQTKVIRKPRKPAPVFENLPVIR